MSFSLMHALVISAPSGAAAVHTLRIGMGPNGQSLLDAIDHQPAAAVTEGIALRLLFAGRTACRWPRPARSDAAGPTTRSAKSSAASRARQTALAPGTLALCTMRWLTTG